MSGARIAGLPMYEIDGLRPVIERFWSGLAGALRAAGLQRVPDGLDHSLRPEELWTHPDLLLAQTCGYPFTHALRGRVQLVATPCYASPFCRGPLYTSLVMARADDARRRLADFGPSVRVAINDLSSHSGHVALRATLAGHAGPARWTTRAIVTGSHVASLRAIRDHNADLAAVDCVVAALLERHAPEDLAGLRILEVSPAAPGLPFVTSVGTSAADTERLRTGLKAAMTEPGLDDVRRALLIEDVRFLPNEAYQRILELEETGAAIRLMIGDDRSG